MNAATLKELFGHNDWANQKILSIAADLPDAALDRSFEMGEGTLRRTLNHMIAAERVWLDRWKKHATPRYRSDPAGTPIAALSGEFREVAAERDAFLTSCSQVDLNSPLHYKNTRGDAFAFVLGDLMLHVYNHGVHHRAQAVNMLRHVGAATPKPGVDYIFWKVEQACGGTEPPAAVDFDLASIRRYFDYSDWARGQVHAIAAKLTDAQLDREFAMGVGTLRKTLLHIRFAEEWWLQNWTLGPDRPFPELPDGPPIAELDKLFADTVVRRKAYLATLIDADLKKITRAKPRPGVERVFPLGMPMLQLCCHGTLHRAQAVNMLRHVGAEVPALDVVMFLRAPAGIG